jgi:hypothetical protein
MNKQGLILLTSYDQVPPDMTEAEAREFWDSHSITEEYLASAPPVSDDDLPPAGRQRKYVAVHLPRGVFHRARGLARQRGVTVSDLIEDMINQRVDAEESRVRAAGS